MASFLYRLGRFAYRRRWLVAGLWVALLLAALAGATALSGPTSDSFRIPGTPSQQVCWVADVFARLFLTYIWMPPADPNFGDDAELRRFAHEVLTPMVGRAGQKDMA